MTTTVDQVTTVTALQVWHTMQLPETELLLRVKQSVAEDWLPSIVDFELSATQSLTPDQTESLFSLFGLFREKTCKGAAHHLAALLRPHFNGQDGDFCKRYCAERERLKGWVENAKVAADAINILQGLAHFTEWVANVISLFSPVVVVSTEFGVFTVLYLLDELCQCDQVQKLPRTGSWNL